MMMRAIKTFDYNRRRLRPGDVFELQAGALETIEAHRKVFLTAQMAEDIDEPKKSKKRYQTTRLQAEEDK
jgi:hypothetical protein